MSESYQPPKPKLKPTRKSIPFWFLVLGILAAGLGIMVLGVAGVYAPSAVPYPTGFVHTVGGLNLPVTTHEL